ncbi:carbonic anhydrase [Longirhabdus pacifica]|uniref:carbonic anhydrase n=1 Tax=Longirhabdus pacifica TaxID=2305227 RepID=UPI00100912A0|nr:carbonic anhydrase family protein [Longirhabdus pacifica]
MKKWRILLVIATIVVTMTACNDDDNISEEASGTNIVKEESNNHQEGYSYENQEDWTMVWGKSQSPINIQTADTTKGNADSITLDYNTNPTYIIDDGHTIKVGAEGNEAIINNRPFQLLQFHFHSSSEHTIDGDNYPIEGHFVHSADNGALAVIGVMFVEGSNNPEFEKILTNIAEEKQENLSIELDYNQLLPDDKSYYHYLGSLTTPPLTENVEWYVLENHVEISKEQIEQFQAYYDDNFRKVQPLNDRPIIYFEQ